MHERHDRRPRPAAFNGRRQIGGLVVADLQGRDHEVEIFFLEAGHGFGRFMHPGYDRGAPVFAVAIKCRHPLLEPYVLVDDTGIVEAGDHEDVRYPS